MTPKEFVVWMKGFAQAANNFTLTPKQWDDIREELSKVEEVGGYSISVGTGATGATNTTARLDTTYNTDVLTTKTLLTDNKIY